MRCVTDGQRSGDSDVARPCDVHPRGYEVSTLGCDSDGSARRVWGNDLKAQLCRGAHQTLTIRTRDRDAQSDCFLDQRSLCCRAYLIGLSITRRCDKHRLDTLCCKGLKDLEVPLPRRAHECGIDNSTWHLCHIGVCLRTEVDVCPATNRDHSSSKATGQQIVEGNEAELSWMCRCSDDAHTPWIEERV